MRALACLLVVLCSGCATVNSVQDASIAHDRRFLLKESCVQVSVALKEALGQTGFKIEVEVEEEEEEKGADGCVSQIVATHSISLFSWGEIVRVQLRPHPDGLQLAIRTDRRVATNVTARGDWADEIYQALIRQLMATN